MTPRSVPASIERTCWCWWGGKKSSMRLIDSAASTVWIVESTRWPVSAADSAVWTVSSSRISPIRITSGSWRRTRRSARLKEAVSMPTSRWLITERRSRVDELDRVLDRDDVRRRGLVDVVDHRRERRRLARAGRAGDQDDPALLVGQLADHRRQRQLLDRADPVRDRAATSETPPRWRKALMRKRATPGSRARGRSRARRSNSASWTSSCSRSCSAPSVSRRSSGRSVVAQRAELAVDAGQRQRADLQVQVGSVARDERAKCSGCRSFVTLIGAASAMT